MAGEKFGLGLRIRRYSTVCQQAHRLFLVCVTALFELKGLPSDRTGVIILGVFSDSL